MRVHTMGRRDHTPRAVVEVSDNRGGGIGNQHVARRSTNLYYYTRQKIGDPSAGMRSHAWSA